MEKKQELWINNVKVIACFLVLAGHLMQSMSSEGFIPVEGFYTWFNQTIYYFHVPLFFICSGYLYQKFSNTANVKSWGKNVLKKLVSLGVPYLFFECAVWCIKAVFVEGSGNRMGQLIEVIFLNLSLRIGICTACSLFSL